MTKKKPNSATAWVDPDAAPALTQEWFDGADLYDGKKLVRKGGRPPVESPKQAVSLRLDADLLEHFRAGGPGWQSRINAALRKVAKL